MASKEARNNLLTHLGSHKGKLQWSELTGQCVYRKVREEPCPGPPGLGCEGRYTDDYGMYQYCRICMGKGTIRVPSYVRVPAFDAPEVPNDWVPDWIRAEKPKSKRKKKRKA